MKESYPASASSMRVSAENDATGAGAFYFGGKMDEREWNSHYDAPAAYFAWLKEQEEKYGRER